MLDKGQNTNDDFNEMSDCSSTEMSSNKKENFITSAKGIRNITSPSTATTALSTSSENIKAENKFTSKQHSLYNVASSPPDSSALSANSKLIILGMQFNELKPCNSLKNIKFVSSFTILE